MSLLAGFFFKIYLWRVYIFTVQLFIRIKKKENRSRLEYLNIALDCVYLLVRPLWNSLTHKPRKAIYTLKVDVILDISFKCNKNEIVTIKESHWVKDRRSI